MSGPRIVQTVADFGITLDWLLTPQGALDATRDLETAVIMALGTDRLAAAPDELPTPGDTDRRGYWGDLDAKPIWGEGPLGSRLWLLSRAKIVGSGARGGSTVERVRTYIKEALQGFIDDRVCSKIDVQVERGGDSAIHALVTMYRGNLRAVDLRFAALWDE